MALRLGLFALMVFGVTAVNLQALRGAGHRGCHQDPVAPEKMADSEIVDGNDCGNVKVVVAKYGKSTAVGKLAGETKNVITGAESAVAASTEAQEKATKAAESARAVGGARADGAAEDADKAIDEAGGLQVDAESAVDDAKDALSNMKGDVKDKPYEVEQKLIDKSKKMKDKTVDATRKLAKSTEVLKVASKKAVKEALSSAENALKMISELVKSTEEQLKATTEARQKAVWAGKETKKTVEAAEEVGKELDKKIEDNEGDQAPVFQGIKDGLMAAVESANTKTADLEDLVKALETSDTAAREAFTPVSDKKDEMAGGAGDATGAGEMADAMSTLEGALKVLAEDTTKVKMATADLQKKKERVGETAGKAADFGIPWAPPPETPFGAPGEGRVGDN